MNTNPVSPKIVYPAVAGALVTILVWVLDATAHVTPPAAVQGALTVVAMVFVGWIIPDPLRATLRAVEDYLDGIDATVPDELPANE